MAAKLKSISRQIHWSSLLKAFVFGAAWFFLPFWAFALIALYLYFIPFAQTRNVIIPFLVLLLLASVEAQGSLFALIFGALFFYILLIKDLLLIDRKSAYEVLVFSLAFLLFRSFYINVGGMFSGKALLYSVLVAALFAFLQANFIRAFELVPLEKRVLARTTNWLSFLLIWQFMLAGLFLPLDFIYQSAIVFLVAMFLIDIIPQYIFGDLTRRKMLGTASVVFALLIIVLGSARWGL